MADTPSQLTDADLPKWKWLMAHGAACCSTLFWAANFPLIKFLQHDAGFDPISLFWSRYLLASMTVVVMWLILRPNFKALQWKHWFAILFICISGGPVYQILLMTGAPHVSSTLIAMLVATQTLHVGWLAWIMLHERYRWWNMLALLIAGIGIIFTVMLGDREGISITGEWYHVGFIGLAGLVSAFFVVIPRKLGPRISARDLMGVTITVGWLTGTPALIYAMTIQGHPPIWEQLSGLSIRSWIGLTHLSTIGHTFAIFIWWWALKHLKATSVAVYLLTMMAFSGFWGWVIMNESFHWSESIAMTAMFLALLVNMAGKDKAPVSTKPATDNA